MSPFSCGKPALDRWLKRRALADQQQGFTAVLVVHAGGRLVGSYGLAPIAVTRGRLRCSVRTGEPPDPAPCLLVGQLAADIHWAGSGIGTGLVKHALERAVAAAWLVGQRALMVSALDEGMARFWRRCGFLPSQDDPFIRYRIVRSQISRRH